MKILGWHTSPCLVSCLPCFFSSLFILVGFNTVFHSELLQLLFLNHLNCHGNSLLVSSRREINQII